MREHPAAAILQSTPGDACGSLMQINPLSHSHAGRGFGKSALFQRGERSCIK